MADSIVSKAGGDVPKYSGTFVSRTFIKTRERSWQSHLRRISHYLLCGKEAWWKETEEGYCFLDGDQDSPTHPEGPYLRHFRTTTLKEVATSSRTAWDEVTEKKIELPTTGIIVYNQEGDPINRQDNSTMEIPNTDDTTTENQDESTLIHPSHEPMLLDERDVQHQEAQASGEVEQLK